MVPLMSGKILGGVSFQVFDVKIGMHLLYQIYHYIHGNSSLGIMTKHFTGIMKSSEARDRGG